jgi:type II secretory pathway pseudopilin PulG
MRVFVPVIIVSIIVVGLLIGVLVPHLVNNRVKSQKQEREELRSKNRVMKVSINAAETQLDKCRRDALQSQQVEPNLSGMILDNVSTYYAVSRGNPDEPGRDGKE